MMLPSCLPLCLAWCACVVANINLYVQRSELQPFTGVRGGAIYYIREGVLNRYAAGYVVPVAANVSLLHFYWQNLIRKPMPYEIGIKWNDVQAMREPILNISHVGYVPRIKQAFSIHLPCTGALSAAVDVQIGMNITTHVRKHRVVRLLLKRSKTCLQGHYNTLQPGSRSGSHKKEAPAPRLDDDTRSPQLQLAVAVVAAVVGTSCFLAVMTLACLKQRATSQTTSGYAGTYTTNRQVLLKKFAKNCSTVDNLVKSSSYATVASLQKMLRGDPPGDGGLIAGDYLDASPLQSSESSPDNSSSKHYASSYVSQIHREEPRYMNQQTQLVQDRNDDVTTTAAAIPPLQCSSLSTSPASTSSSSSRSLTVLDASRIRVGELVRENAGAQMFRGTFQPSGTGTECCCLLKTLTPGSDSQSHHEMLTQASRLLKCSRNARRVLVATAACIMSPTSSTWLVYLDTAADLVNLHHLLTSCRRSGQPGSGRQLSEQNQVDMCVQLMSAVQFVHSSGLVHSDLAARNCVVDHRLHVRLSDAALSRQLFAADYHQLSADQPSLWPVRWMAPETISHAHLTRQSDLWAAAVTCWEIASLGDRPYADVADTSAVAQLIAAGHTLSAPVNTPQELYAIIRNCWKLDFKLRPTVTHVIQELKQLSASFDRLI